MAPYEKRLLDDFDDFDDFETAERRLRQLQRDFMQVLAETKEYYSRHNLVQQDFPAKHVRRRRNGSDELFDGEI